MIFNQHLRAADESVEIRFNSSGDSACFYLKDGEAIMYDSIHSLIRHQYFGEQPCRAYYLEEGDLDWIYGLDVYSFGAIMEAIEKKAISDARQLECDAAREVLKKHGYFVDNLWHVDDVKSGFNCDDNKAQEILNEVLTDGWLTSATNDLIEAASNRVK